MIFKALTRSNKNRIGKMTKEKKRSKNWEMLRIFDRNIIARI
jgi:hypothetical protein